jgi:hypothetical protein
VDTGLDELDLVSLSKPCETMSGTNNEAELGVLVLSVFLKMLADSDGLHTISQRDTPSGSSSRHFTFLINMYTKYSQQDSQVEGIVSRTIFRQLWGQAYNNHNVSHWDQAKA